MRQRQLGVELQRGGIIFNRVIQPPLRVVNPREIVVRRRRFRIDGQRGLIVGDGFRVFFLFAEDDAQKNMRLLLHGFEPKRLFIFRHRLIRPV